MRRHLPTTIGALVLACLAAVAAHGQPTRQLIDLSFKGGTVGDYVAVLRTKAPNVNIVVVPGADGVQLPPFELRSVDLHSAINLLQTVVEEREDRSVMLDVAITPARSPEASQVYTVRAADRGRRASPPRESLVLAIEDILRGGMEAEALLTAIETSLDLLAGETDPAQIRFHEATGILIARGHPLQMSTIAEVVDQIRRNVSFRMQEERREEDARKEQAELEREFVHRLQMAEDRVEQRELEIVELKAQLREAQTLLMQLRAGGGGEGGG
ncbi:MAG: hypothetical protein ACYTJ0_05035 [Planctomycetota bacterium]|jgi:hypothetical protein